MAPADGRVNAAELVGRIREGDQSAVEQLYQITQRARYRLVGRLRWEDAEDAAHDVFVSTLGAIRDNRLICPEKLFGFVAGGLWRQVVFHGTRYARGRRSIDPEHLADPRATEGQLLLEERRRLVTEALKDMCPLEREIIIRFYLRGEAPEDICRRMRLSPAQFSHGRSRAKRRLIDLVRSRLAQPRTLYVTGIIDLE